MILVRLGRAGAGRLFQLTGGVPRRINLLCDRALLGAYAGGLAQVTPAIVRQALSRFTSSFEQTPGRLNVFDGHGFRVILDYAHNPAGLLALRKVTEGMRQAGRVIGMVSIPGDRRDEDAGMERHARYARQPGRLGQERRLRKAGARLAHLALQRLGGHQTADQAARRRREDAEKAVASALRTAQADLSKGVSVEDVVGGLEEGLAHAHARTEAAPPSKAQ